MKISKTVGRVAASLDIHTVFNCYLQEDILLNDIIRIYHECEWRGMKYPMDPRFASRDFVIRPRDKPDQKW